jgi:hypothetical protein
MTATASDRIDTARCQIGKDDEISLFEKKKKHKTQKKPKQNKTKQKPKTTCKRGSKKK